MPTSDAVIEIIGVEQLSSYELKLRFSDGTERAIDFEPFLKTSRNQLIRAYLDPEKFTDFRVEYGDLVWDDYGLCFPIADLYDGQILGRRFDKQSGPRRRASRVSFHWTKAIVGSRYSISSLTQRMSIEAYVGR